MPPIAEEMAGGGTTGPPGSTTAHQRQQQQQQQRKSPVRARSPSTPKDSGNKDKQPQPQSQPQAQAQPRQRPQPEQAVKAVPLLTSEDTTGSSTASTNATLDDLPNSNGAGSYDILTLRSVVPKKKQEEVGTMDRYSTDPGVGAEFFKKEPCLYSHRMFERAAKIFLGLKEAREAKLERQPHGVAKTAAGGGGKGALSHRSVDAGSGASGVSGTPGAPFESLDFKNVKEQKLTYELAFASLKFEMVFQDMLEDCAFFSVYPDLRDSECQVMVVLWDYQSRKFQPRIQFDADELVKEISDIESAIVDQKVKLAASLARRRIRESAPTIDFLLPDKFRSKAGTSVPLPVYAWVNTVKISPAELLFKVKGENYKQLWTVPKSAKEFPEKSFYLDTHCSDTLVFSLDCNAPLQEHALVEQGYLVKQDKSSCLGAHSVVHLMGDEQDVLVVNPGAGMTAAHLAALIQTRKGNVIVVSDGSTEDYNKMMRNFELLGVSKYVKVIEGNFLDMDHDDVRLRTVRAALVIAECSKSAIANIVNYIVTEGENLKMLQQVSEHSEDMDDHLNHLQNNHVAVLRHTLKLPRILGVTYLTRSMYGQENEAVVQRAIEFVNMVQVPRQLKPWRVIPPVLPFSSEEVEDQVGIQGKHAFFQPSTLMNGCFLVCIAREPEDAHTVRAKIQRSKTGSNSGSSDGAKGKKGGGGRKKAGLKQRKVSSSASTAPASRSGSSSPTSARSGKERVPEHVKVVKHPAPFR